MVGGRAHLVEADPGLWVEVDAKLVGMDRVVGPVRPEMQADTSEVHRPEHVGDVVRRPARWRSCRSRW